MAIEKIDQTTPYPDGSFGDDAFTAFGKINNNFDAQQADIEAEQQARAQADSALSTRIDGLPTNANLQAEVTARQNADTALGVRIDNEATARADADTALSQAVSAEVTARQNADTALSQAVSAEVTARQNADTALGARIPGKNVLINGDFRIWQRGVVQAEVDNNWLRRYTTADRWFAASKTTKIGNSRQAFTPGQTEVPGNPRYYSRYSSNSGLTAESLAYFGQSIEGVGTFAGQTVTVSFYARGNTAAKLAVNFVQDFGTGGSTAVDTITAPLLDITTQWKLYTVTVQLPSVTGKTIGSANDHLRIRFWMDAGANHAAASGGLTYQTWTVDIANVQLEQGGTATGFEQRNDAIELVLCQRYYEKSYNLGVVPGTVTREGCYNSGALTTYLLYAPVVRFSQRKRSTPAITFYNTQDGSSGQLSENGQNGLHVTNKPASADQIGSMSFEVFVPNGTATPGNVERFHWTADSEL